MDIKAMATRRMRQLLRRAIGRRCLVFLLPLNAGAWQEDDGLLCGNGELSTYISGVRLVKNIVISYSQKQESSIRLAKYFPSYHLVCGGDCFSFLSRPHSRRCLLPRFIPPYKGASSNDVAYSVVHGSVNDRDPAAYARESGGSKPIILNSITYENGSGIWVENRGVWGRGAGRRVAIYRLGCQPKAGKNGADIGAELPLFHIGGGIPLTISESSGEPRGDCRAYGDNQSRPRHDHDYPIGPIVVLLGSIVTWQIAFQAEQTLAQVTFGLFLEVCGLLLFVVSSILLGLHYMPVPSSETLILPYGFRITI